MQAKAGNYVICFDVGNVLVELGPTIDSWLEPQDILQVRILLDDYSIGNIGTEAFFKNLKAISKHPDGAIPIEQWFIEKRLKGPFPGAVELLSKLADLEVEVVLFSNTNEAHWNHIKKYAFQYEDAFVSFLMKKKKPSQDAFKDVERSIRSAAEEVIFFDDSLANINTAKSLGWNAHLAAGPNPVDGIIRTLRSVYGVAI
ncbi:HAD family hydrolase [Stutzerimonas stutzeri]|nr:HAD-IA family hydrolase [Stutzerimonas stutzeri]MCQ4321555.1 HAD-IA family hydrolase [Stutzerimonas stutzeri]